MKRLAVENLPDGRQQIGDQPVLHHVADVAEGE
jgi:hypothetical protein